MWANNYLWHGHDGGINGFRSIYMYSREADFGLALSVNGGNYWGLFDEIMESYLGQNTYRIPPQTIHPIPKELADKYAGYYNYINPRNQLTYCIEKLNSGVQLDFYNNYLTVTSHGGHLLDTLYYVGNHRFQRMDEGVPLVQFFDDAAGEPVLWLGDGYAKKESKVIRNVKNGLLYVAGLMSLSGVLVGLFWWVRGWFDKTKKMRRHHWVLWLAAVCLFASPVVFLLLAPLMEVPESLHVGSLLLFLGSIAFFVLSLVSLGFCFFLRGEGRWFKLYYRLTAFCLVGVGFWLLYNGLIGFRVWDY